MGIIGISGCISTGEGSGNGTAITTSNNSTFENQYVKFKIPPGFKVEDNSIGGNIDISFYKGDKIVGDLSGLGTIWNTTPSDALGTKTTIAGKKAYENNNSNMGNSAIVIIETDKSGNKKVITLNFDTEYPDAYNTIKTTLEINKVP